MALLGCHDLIFKITIRVVLRRAGHQCNLAESSRSGLVNPARDFDGQTLVARDVCHISEFDGHLQMT